MDGLTRMMGGTIPRFRSQHMLDPHPYDEMPVEELYEHLENRHDALGLAQDEMTKAAEELREDLRYAMSRPDFSPRQLARRLDLSTQRVYQIAKVKRSEIKLRSINPEEQTA